MEFYSAYNVPPMTYHRKCEKTAPIYEEQINTQTNQLELKKVGETNVYEMIQESRDATDIQKIIEKYQINIDNKVEIRDEILDYTENPTSLIEAHQMILNAEQIWNKEPLKVREKFNNNFEQYLAAANNGELKNAYNELLPKQMKELKETKEANKIAEVQRQQENIKNQGVNVNE